MRGAPAAVFRPIGFALLVVTAGLGLLAGAEVQAQSVGLMYLVANVCLFVATLVDPTAGGARFMIAFYFLFIVAIPAQTQIATGVFPTGSSYESSQLLSGFAVFSVGQISLIAGQRYGSHRAARSAPKRVSVSPAFLRRVVVIATVISAAVVLAVGVGALLATRGDRGASLTGQTGVSQQLQFIGRSTSLVAAVVCVYLLRKQKTARQSAPFLALSVVAGVAFLLLHYPPALSRFELLGTVIAVLSVAVSFFSSKIKIVLGLAAPALLYLFFPLLKSIGSSTSGGGVGRRFGYNVESYLTSVDFDSYKQVVDTTMYLQGGGQYRYGINFLGAFLFFVPRSLWSAKPVDSGQIVSETLGYRYNNVANPLVSEGLISLGYLGTIAAMLVLGIVVGRLEFGARLAQTRELLQQQVLGYALLTGFLVIILRGSLNGTAPIFATGFLFYIAMVAVQHKQARRQPPGDEVSTDGDNRLHDPGRTEGVDVLFAAGATPATSHLHAGRRESVLRRT